ncbi:cuticle protein 16.5 [Monomorium pharaonis]|uniref:cuticle protein 16.5 n=1 Tax=Monomorium pharaonis TaxID=307658 RepID=UPI00063EFC3D|nr:cuticle protein 16.5 [Monomorium pharaonis]XP_036140664.1 cuticle protein 16.5 [Monomorium pharaonis]
MVFKLVLLAAFVAAASAGGPAAYDIGTVSADLGSIGYSQESTQKGYAGQNVVSTYSRAEDSAHSSVRVSNSHVSNDALLGHPAIGYGYAAPALAKPLIAAQPVIAKAAYAAAAPALATYATHPAPVLAKTAYAAPAYSYAAAAAAPAYGYAAAPAYGYAAAPAPILAAKAAYAAPAAYGYASPLLTKTYGYAAPAPLPLIAKTAAYTTYAAPAATPLVAKAAYAAPLVAKTYSPAPLIAKTYAAPYSYETAVAPVVAHATFSGFGTSYAW